MRRGVVCCLCVAAGAALLLGIAVVSTWGLPRAPEPDGERHLRTAKLHLPAYQRFAGSVAGSTKGLPEMKPLDVPADLRALGVLAIEAGRQSVAFLLPTHPLDANVAVICLPADEDPAGAAAKVLGVRKVWSVEKLSDRWCFVCYD
jgi:hypothetical protein